MISTKISVWTGISFNGDEDLLRALSLRAQDFDCVFVTGSLVEGFGNSASDLDIYAVGREETPTSKPVVSIQNLGSRRVDIERWQQVSVRSLLDRLDALVFDGSPELTGAIPAIELRFLWRAAVGIPLAGHANFESIRTKVISGPLSRYLVNASLYRAMEAAEDTSGMIEAKDYYCAVLRAQDLVGLALDAFLQTNGQLNPNAKWRVRAFDKILALASPEQRADLELLWNSYVQHRFGGEIRKDNASEYVAAAFALANNFLRRCRRDV